MEAAHVNGRECPMPYVLANGALWLIVMLATAAVALASPPSPADARQPALNTTVWCDEAEQIETFLRTHVGDGLALQAAVARTNAAARSPDACVAATAAAVETGEARRLVVGNNVVAIEQYLVIGVVKDGLILQIEPVTWFAAKFVAQLTPL